MILKNKIIAIVSLFLSTLLFSSSHDKILQKDFYSDESGNIYMSINVLGHVKSPGTYLIYEGADILTILSQAGGPLPGAKLKTCVIHQGEGKVNIVDLESIIYNGNELNIDFKPNDTIFIKQTIGSYLLTKATLINSLFHLLNLYLTISNIN